MGASFKDLVVWQKAIELTLSVYELTARFPHSERFGLINQLRRAAVSVPSNIAEGYGKTSKGEYVHFLGHARGSVCEVQTQLLISEKLGYGSQQHRVAAAEQAEHVSRMLNALVAKLQA